MNLMEWLLLFLIAGLCGSLGQAIAGYSRGGCLVSIALGLVGALLGRYLSGVLGLPEIFVISVGGAPFPIVWSIIGAALFVGLLGLLKGGGRR